MQYWCWLDIDGDDMDSGSVLFRTTADAAAVAVAVVTHIVIIIVLCCWCCALFLFWPHILYITIRMLQHRFSVRQNNIVFSYSISYAVLGSHTFNHLRVFFFVCLFVVYFILSLCPYSRVCNNGYSVSVCLCACVRLHIGRFYCIYWQ